MLTRLEQETIIKKLLNKREANHSFRVSRYSYEFAKILALNRKDTVLLTTSARWHDIGKSCIDSCILDKEGKLSKIELDLMRNHTVYSEAFLRENRCPSEIIVTVRAHHECWDGTGYPDGLKDKEIPFLARIIRILDVYDALTNTRPYRENNYTHREAVKIIADGRTTLFDPYLVDVFLFYCEAIVASENSLQYFSLRKETG